MGQFKKFKQGTRSTQAFDDPEADAAAAMHGNPGRLGDDQQGLIFMDDGEFDRPGFHPRADRNADRGTTYLIPLLQPVSGIHALAVDPDFTAAQDAVDVAARHPLADPQQEVIHTLVGLAGIHDRHRSRGRPEPLMVRQWGRLRGNRPDGPALGCPPGCRGPCVV